MIPANQDMPEATRKLRAQPPTTGPAANSPGEKRGAWYLLTGVILGLIFGLAYAWLLNPVVYENATPASLRDSSKDIYRSLIAQTYKETGNLARAASRLALLEDPDPVYALGAQAQQALAEGQPVEAHALALLASALGSSEPAQAESAPTIPTQTLPNPTPTP